MVIWSYRTLVSLWSCHHVGNNEDVYEWMDPPQIDPSSTIDRSQIDRPWFDRESTLHRSRIDPGSTQKRSRIDPGSKQDLEFGLTADRSWIVPESTLDRLKSDPVGPLIEINPSIYRPKNIDHCCLYELLIVCLWSWRRGMLCCYKKWFQKLVSRNGFKEWSQEMVSKNGFKKWSREIVKRVSSHGLKKWSQ